MADVLTAEVRRVAAPAIAHSLLQTLVFVVDRLMLGRHSETALAAMQIAGSLEWSVWSVFAAFEVGTIARVGRHVGAERPGAARRAAWVSLALALAMGVVVAVASRPVLAHLGALVPGGSPAAIDAARGYLAITLAASPVVFVAMSCIATLQAGGDTRTPLAIGVVSNLVHIAMNAALIPRYGARGCAVSTAATFAIETAATLAVLSWRGGRGRVSLRRRGEQEIDVPASDEARAMVRVAFPAMLERVLYHVGFTAFALLITALGDVSMAANQALISVESICFLSADGFGVAAAALVAQKLGKGRADEAVSAARIATRDAVVLLTALGAAFFLARDWVLPLFCRDAEVVRVGMRAFPLLAVAQPFLATSIVLGQALRGGGFTRHVLAVSAASALVVRVVATWGFGIALGLGLPGVWMGSTSDWLVRTALLVIVALRLQRRSLSSPARSRRRPSTPRGGARRRRRCSRSRTPSATGPTPP